RRATKDILPDKVRLNHLYKGIQGADGINRLIPNWSELLKEFQGLLKDSIMDELLNRSVIECAITKTTAPKPELIFDKAFKLLMRGVILHRFLKRRFERG